MYPTIRQTLHRIGWNRWALSRKASWSRRLEKFMAAPFSWSRCRQAEKAFDGVLPIQAIPAAGELDCRARSFGGVAKENSAVRRSDENRSFFLRLCHNFLLEKMLCSRKKSVRWTGFPTRRT
jgi:hypothetical protein